MSSTSDTINIKGNRKVVCATYEVKSVFRIPDGLDLEDKNVVVRWCIKYNSLMIEYVGKKEVEYHEATWDAFDGSDSEGYRMYYPVSRVEIDSEYKLWFGRTNNRDVPQDGEWKTLNASMYYREEDKELESVESVTNNQ